MTVLEMLTEVIGSEKLLGLIALAKLMLLTQMFGSHIPVRRVRKFLAAVATHVVSRRMDVRWVESGRNPTKCCARPRMLAQMQRVLMALGLVLILESVRTIRALVLFLHFVHSTMYGLAKITVV
jgi:hypothetical protein